MNIKNKARWAGVVTVLALAGCGSTVAATQTAASPPSPTAIATTATDPNGLACVALDKSGYCPGDSPLLTQAPAKPKATPTHKVTPKATPTPTQAPVQPAGPTASQQQALISAQSYLDLGSGFSWQGLVDQLDSPYGGQFSGADATWAANHSGADWNAQAVLAAKGYLALGTGFSRQGLIDQLDSPYGGKFTVDQATYAVGKVGL